MFDAATIFAVVSNVFASVGIVTLNKVLFFHFHFRAGTLMTAGHFLTSSCVFYAYKRYKGWNSEIPWDKLKLAAVFSCLATILMNLSLRSNIVSVYQLSKIFVVPASVFFEITLDKKQFSRNVLLSLFAACIGMGIATVYELRANLTGTIYALLAVLFQTLCNIYGAKQQKDIKAPPIEILAKRLPAEALMTSIATLLIDVGPGGSNFDDWNIPLVFLLLLTCAFAPAVTASSFYALGYLNPIGFQIIGNIKTILVLVLGVMLFDDPFTERHAFGFTLTLVAMYFYFHFTEQEKKEKAATAAAAASAAAATASNADTKPGETVVFIDPTPSAKGSAV
jgi:solute carrier family 35 protein E3